MSGSNSWRFWCRHQQLVAHSHLRRFSRKVMQVLLRKPGFVAIECLVASNCLEVFRGYLVKRIICPKSSIVLNFANSENLFVAGRGIICGQHEQKIKELYTPVKDAHSFHHPWHGGDMWYLPKNYSNLGESQNCPLSTTTIRVTSQVIEITNISPQSNLVPPMFGKSRILFLQDAIV